jgi:hypothetical protein
MSRYHIVNPANVRSEYTEFNTVDFELSFENRKLVANMLRLNFKVDWATSTRDLDKKQMWDNFVGGHSLIDRVDVYMANVGVIETISDYPRYVSATAKPSLSVEDVAFNSQFVCEGRTASAELSNKLLLGTIDLGKEGVTTWANLVDFREPLDVSLKLQCCLNRMLGDNLLPFIKTGMIRLSVQLSKNFYALFGDADLGYQLKDMSIMFMSVPDDGVYSDKYNFRVVTGLPQSLQSTFSNLSVKAPIVADAMFGTAIRQADLDIATSNSLANQRIPNVTELEFIFNDSFSQEITYTFRDSETDILENYIKAVNKVIDSNSCSLDRMAGSDSWGLGLSFGGQFIDLSRNKIGINIRSDINSTDPYVLYLFFSGIVSI